MMQFPAFPRHLTPEERNAVRQVAAGNFADKLLEDTEEKFGTVSDPVRRRSMHHEALMSALTLISLNWLSERMDAVEAAQASKGDA